MKFAKILLIFALGFISAAYAMREVHAQGNSLVSITPVEILSQQGISTNVHGGRVAGISCIPNPTVRMPHEATCYVATAIGGD